MIKQIVLTYGYFGVRLGNTISLLKANNKGQQNFARFRHIYQHLLLAVDSALAFSTCEKCLLI
jgi:hypothetical protein